jgi:hypothetical protein
MPLMKKDYNTWDEFYADCIRLKLDPDRQFNATYSHGGDLIGTFTRHENGGVTYLLRLP